MYSFHIFKDFLYVCFFGHSQGLARAARQLTVEQWHEQQAAIAAAKAQAKAKAQSKALDQVRRVNGACIWLHLDSKHQKEMFMMLEERLANM